MLKRAVEVDRGLPVIVVARCLDMGSHVEAMQLGTTGYLVEPLAAWELGRMLLPTRISANARRSLGNSTLIQNRGTDRGSEGRRWDVLALRAGVSIGPIGLMW